MGRAGSCARRGGTSLRSCRRGITTSHPGSSLATAQVSGVVALLLQKNKRLRTDELLAILLKSTDQRQTARGLVTSVNACAALSQLIPGARCAPPAAAAGT